MPKILRNYYFENGKCIILNINGVFPDMQSGLCELGKEYKEPVPIELENKQIIILEKDELENLLKEQKEQKEKKEEPKRKDLKDIKENNKGGNE